MKTRKGQIIKASNEVDQEAIKWRAARRYTPRAIILARKREKLRKCAVQFVNMNDLSFAYVQDKSIQRVAPIPAA